MSDSYDAPINHGLYYSLKENSSNNLLNFPLHKLAFHSIDKRTHDSTMKTCDRSRCKIGLNRIHALLILIILFIVFLRKYNDYSHSKQYDEYKKIHLKEFFFPNIQTHLDVEPMKLLGSFQRSSSLNKTSKYQMENNEASKVCYIHKTGNCQWFYLFSKNK